MATVDLMIPSVQFSVSYNIHYYNKVSIIATSSCGQTGLLLAYIMGSSYDNNAHTVAAKFIVNL